MFNTSQNLTHSQRQLRLLTIGCMLFLLPSAGFAANATPLFTDINADGLGFGQTDPFAFGIYGLDVDASFMGNDILVQSQNGVGTFGDGAGISLPVSNGENGYTETFDDTAGVPGSNDVSNLDIDNATPPNPIWATIGNTIPPANPTPPFPVTGSPNPRVGLNNGNVLRFSIWVREDPNNPITAAPQIEPVFKFEFWKEALSTFADTNGGQAQTFFGDKIVDTDQHLGEGIWIDLDGNGTVIDAAAAGEGRVRTVNSSSWTLIEAVYEVDDSSWFGISDDVYTVADVEEVRAVMFWGDFVGSNLGGSLWFDNALVEVFANAAAVTPNTNPDPVLSEVNEKADFDNDGDVDGADFLIWQRGFGIGTQNFEGDADFSGNVDGTDLAIWQNLYGTGPLAAIGSVPEPSSVMLLLVSVLSCGGTRRLRR